MLDLNPSKNNYLIITSKDSNLDLFFKKHSPLLVKLVPLVSQCRQICQGVPWRKSPCESPALPDGQTNGIN